MVSSRRHSLLQDKQDAAPEVGIPKALRVKAHAMQNLCKNETHIHVIVCSCGSSALAKDSQFPGAKAYITSLPELPSLHDLISNYIPYDSTRLNGLKQQKYLQLLSRGGLQAEDIAKRSTKYIRNPLRIFGLANRVRTYSSGLLNPQLWFNIFVVVSWLLIRRTLEIFGIHLPGLGGVPQNKQVSPVKSNKKMQPTVEHFQEHDFVHLEAP